VALGASLTACKGKTSDPSESEPTPVSPAAQASQDVAPSGGPVKLVRDVGRAPVEVDTSAPANVRTVPEDASRSESGLAWVVLNKGTGEAHPTMSDVAVVNFIGWTADGKLVQESLTTGRGAAIAVGSMFPGLAEGVQSMVAGEKRRFWIPGKLAFGEAKPGEPPAEKGPPLGTVVYDVELLRFGTPAPKSAE
jgi:peptidylprolyl isomerase